MKTILIGGDRPLFKVYIIWNSYFYLELLRPMERLDFSVIGGPINSLDFITGDSWVYDLEYKLNSNGSKSSLVCKSKYTIQFNYREELMESLLPYLDKKKLTDMLDNLYECFFTGSHVSYNYVGCSSNESRDKKDKLSLEKLREINRTSGETRISKLYEKSMEKLVKSIEYYNSDYHDRVRYAFRDNSDFHDDIRRRYSEESNRLVDEIESKRLIVSGLVEEIEKLSKVVGDEHKSIMKENVMSMTDIPLKLKDIILNDVDTQIVIGENEKLFSRDGVIRIKKLT